MYMLSFVLYMRWLSILLIPSLLLGDYTLNRAELCLGPSYSYLWRQKKGGSELKGSLYGGEFRFDRLKRYSWYLGGTASYRAGILHSHPSLRSRYSDFFSEGRFGYTFQQKCCPNFSFTPFVGGGYILTRNNFLNPSPLPIHFKTDYPFASAGFISRIYPFSCFEMGLDLNARLPIDPNCEVTKDPDHDDMSLRIGEKVSYQISLPLIYSMTPSWSLQLRPQYEQRLYGHHPNFPFDFIETKEQFFSLMLLLQWRI